MKGVIAPRFFSGGNGITVFVDDSVSTTFTRKRQVFFREVSLPQQVALPKEAVDIDDLVAEFEMSDSANQQAISDGRKWVAQEFYSTKPGLAKIRLALGLSQSELARRAETSQPYIARLEQGKVDPQFSTMQKIAAALGVSIADFADAMASESNQ